MKRCFVNYLLYCNMSDILNKDKNCNVAFKQQEIIISIAT